jgi:hypothetical protein
MNTIREDLIACLHVKGFGKPEALAEALGAPSEAVEAALAELVAHGEAEQFRVGARLSGSGKAAAEQACVVGFVPVVVARQLAVDQPHLCQSVTSVLKSGVERREALVFLR